MAVHNHDTRAWVEDASAPEYGLAEESLVMDVGRFARRCLPLIRRIRRTGEVIVLTRRGKPVARLQPIPHPSIECAEDDPLTWDVEAVEP